ncbi:pre-rRNA-processing protein esf1 isoform X2 [Carica papaya]|uniref:pre-rRNA-processing protein esf1 isoform X1 n=1 Tax=Carica papaya TaxID=3649 RepID=UPI000B8C9DB6|nr:pre-rRNA-processing protein esf1 isoform X1 [Carica papaya]XP_021907989.1 pre-rRNA-processing protein esf1 isoform X2 [Carica papaya]
MGSKNRNRNKRAKPGNSDDATLPSKSRNGHHPGDNESKIISDPRFASVHSDPRFQKVSKRESKVAIDARFQRAFTDKRFASSSAPLDKRGKPKKEKSSGDSLRHFYRMEEDEEQKERRRQREDTDSEEEAEEPEEESEEEELGESEGEEESETESEDEKLVAEGGEVESTTDEEEEDEEVVYDDGEPEIQEENIPVIEKETRRLAVVNMDWRHVKAVDLYVVLSSFLPKDGHILSVSIYPSEFGLQRMKEEEVQGPVGLFDDENEEKDKDDDDDDEIDNEKLRAYERSRLRYYYGVVECDSSATADYLYKACDGTEFERSSNVFDLRFIPDSMEFKHEACDVATEGPSNYEGLNFQTQALQLSKIRLSWDEDEPQRVKTLKRTFNAEQLAELELKEFLADESDIDDDEDEITEDQFDEKQKKQATGSHPDEKLKKRDIYRALLQSGDGSDEEGKEDEDEGQDMEVTFNTGLEDLSKRILEKKDKKSETVWEAYLRKRREKKAARKNKSKYSSEDDESSDTDQEAIAEQPDDFFLEEPPVKRLKKDVRGRSDKEGKQHQDTEKETEASRAELELLLADDKGVESGVKGYNLKPKKVKGKKGKEIIHEDKIPAADYDDPRFSSLFTSPLFALDPTDPQFKRSAAYARQVAQKQQKSDRQELVGSEPKKLPKKAQLPSEEAERSEDKHTKTEALPSKEKIELSSLVKSLKMKTKQVQLPSNNVSSKKRKNAL